MRGKCYHQTYDRHNHDKVWPPQIYYILHIVYISVAATEIDKNNLISARIFSNAII